MIPVVRHMTSIRRFATSFKIESLFEAKMACAPEGTPPRTSLDLKGSNEVEQAPTVYSGAIGSSAGQTEPKASSSASALNAAVLRERKHKRKFMVKKLEKKLELLDRQIKKYNEAEVSLDEMESGTSAYLKEDFYKRKFVQTWQKLCELQNVPDEIVIEDQSSMNYASTPYPEINRRVQRLLRLDEFPDHFDICQLVDRCNTKHSLGISAEEKSQLSRKIFKDVGKLLKDRRHKDFIAHFGSHLTDKGKAAVDPAAEDLQLMEELKKSLREGQEKLEQLCEGFVIKQDQECPEGGISPEGDSCSLNEEEEDDEQSESGVIGVEGDIEGELETQLEDDEQPMMEQAPLDLDIVEDIEIGTEASGASPSSLCSGEHIPDSTIPSDSNVTSSQPHGSKPAASSQVHSASGGSSSSLDICALSADEQESSTMGPTSSHAISLSDSDSDEVVVISDDD